MISIRTFGRAAPRAVSRLSASALKSKSTRPVSFLKSAFNPSPIQYASAFSTSTFRRSNAAESDEDLIAKLESEIQMENEMKDESGVPTSVKDYLENSPFQIIDTPGQEDVILTRTFGDERIRVTFSIADLNSIDPENEYADRAMVDEEDGSEQKRDDEHDGTESDEEQDQSFPARLNIVIEKPGKGAMAVESMVQDGMVIIDNVYYYADASHATAKSAEKAHERQDLYAGPPFGNLDEDLQVLLERYLEERGINTAMAIFVPDYIDMKEQKEYVRWLGNVKGFVEA